MLLDGRLQKIFAPALCLGLALSVGGCDRMITPRHAQVIKDAESKAADGNYLRAITLYESALDGSAKSAEIHYRLALLYDDKMHDPLNALHHFKRYLTLAPTGPHANEVKNFMKKDELELGTTLSGDSVVSRAEAARLKNENLTLRKELEDQRARLQSATTARKRPEILRKKKLRAPPRNPGALLGPMSCATAIPWPRSRENFTSLPANGKKFWPPIGIWLMSRES